jgi:hypothetical protein
MVNLQDGLLFVKKRSNSSRSYHLLSLDLSWTSDGVQCGMRNSVHLLYYPQSLWWGFIAISVAHNILPQWVQFITFTPSQVHMTMGNLVWRGLRLPSWLGCLFTHHNNLGSKPIHTLTTLFNHIEKNLCILLFWL